MSPAISRNMKWWWKTFLTNDVSGYLIAIKMAMKLFVTYPWWSVLDQIVLNKMAAIMLDILSENEVFITLITLAEESALCLVLALEWLPLDSIFLKNWISWVFHIKCNVCFFIILIKNHRFSFFEIKINCPSQIPKCFINCNYWYGFFPLNIRPVLRSHP